MKTKNALKSFYRLFLALIFLVSVAAPTLYAQEEMTDEAMTTAEITVVAVDDAGKATATTESMLKGIDTVWLLVAAFLVFFMQAGFAMVEAGFVRAKNTVNILMKNFIDFSLGSMFFFLLGYGFMFGEGPGLIGLTGFAQTDPANMGFLLFQTVFAATAATIVSGAVAERMKFHSYLIYSAVICAVIYPIIGHWSWAGLANSTGGWLENLSIGSASGFLDFAGSTVVHGVGGAMALAGAMVLGPRIGKYNKDGSANVIAGHNMPLAALGVFILWFGWFGFNPGSQAQAGNVGDANAIALIAVNTNLSAAAAAFVAMLVTWGLYKKPDLSMTMNGALAGLVAITAPCDGVTPIGALIIGAVAGILIVASVLFFDKLKIDDPVGAISVHGVNGIWGTLAAGLFNTSSGLFYGGGFGQLGIQAIGTFASTAAAFAAMFVIFMIIKMTIGIRISRQEELRGLDIGEHGMEAYADFQSFSTK